ncbi:hypothetical protein CC1G_02885 [Coprinopsis cinerea okayama7|uniref:Uncharacterized protein n=1 Tax=Coprinopsis cinerea (strain Okayama-7 / 130 / ATCC MYA-4618 / FGSC 9003) TaxID=240176 RepID=A8MZY9_COPC7|nr:hypothetical protein CC1G_02885 [Coprinopsis cinerea okayama7\|eukprot:XP_001828304.1 hypothetical protein CC1G_02885 [Coprinopsis cinerea okayama7\
MTTDYVPGALYLAGFTQARSPHIGLLLAKDANKGTLFHIRIDRETSPNWQFQRRTQPVVGDMFLSSLLRITKDPLPLDTAENTIEEIASSIAPPDNGEFGECAPWALKLVQALSDRGIVELKDVEKLGEEVDSLARDSRAYARRDKFPNLATSNFCR